VGAGSTPGDLRLTDRARRHRRERATATGEPASRGGAADRVKAPGLGRLLRLPFPSPPLHPVGLSSARRRRRADGDRAERWGATAGEEQKKRRQGAQSFGCPRFCCLRGRRLPASPSTRFVPNSYLLLGSQYGVSNPAISVRFSRFLLNFFHKLVPPL